MSSINNYGHDNNLKYPIIVTTTTSSSKILHFSSSSSNQEEHMTRDAMQIINDAIRAVNPYTAIGSNLVRVNDTLKITNKGQQLEYNLSEDYDEIVIIAFGKASSSMATAVIQQIFPKIINNDDSTSSSHNIPCRGVVICKDEHLIPFLTPDPVMLPTNSFKWFHHVLLLEPLSYAVLVVVALPYFAGRLHPLHFKTSNK
jgi:hypothetical protein